MKEEEKRKLISHIAEIDSRKENSIFSWLSKAIENTEIYDLGIDFDDLINWYLKLKNLVNGKIVIVTQNGVKGPIGCLDEYTLVEMAISIWLDYYTDKAMEVFHRIMTANDIDYLFSLYYSIPDHLDENEDGHLNIMDTFLYQYEFGIVVLTKNGVLETRVLDLYSGLDIMAFVNSLNILESKISISDYCSMYSFESYISDDVFDVFFREVESKNCVKSYWNYLEEYMDTNNLWTSDPEYDSNIDALGRDLSDAAEYAANKAALDEIVANIVKKWRGDYYGGEENSRS